MRAQKGHWVALGDMPAWTWRRQLVQRVSPSVETRFSTLILGLHGLGQGTAALPWHQAQLFEFRGVGPTVKLRFSHRLLLVAALELLAVLFIAQGDDTHEVSARLGWLVVPGLTGVGAVVMLRTLHQLPLRDRVHFAALVGSVLLLHLLLVVATYIAVRQPDYLAGAPELAYGFHDTDKIHLAAVACAVSVFALVFCKPAWLSHIARFSLVATLLLAAVWATAFVRILKTSELPPSGGVLPEGCGWQPDRRGELVYDHDSYPYYSLVDDSDRPTRLVAADRFHQQSSLFRFHGLDLAASRQIQGPYVGASRALDGGYIVWRSGQQPVILEHLDEHLQLVRTATFSFRGGVSVRRASPDSYCMVQGNHRYAFLDAELRRRSRASQVTDWLRGTSMISPWASLIALVLWQLTLLFRRLHWRWLYRGSARRFEGVWRGGQREHSIEVDGELYRVRWPKGANPNELGEGEPCVLFATAGSDEEGPYRARATLQVKRWFPGRGSDMEARHRMDTRSLSALAFSVLWALSATAVELIFV